MRRFFFVLFGALVFSASMAQTSREVARVIYEAETGGPSIAINKRSPQNIVIAVPDGSVYTSADGGKSWETSNLAFPYGNLGHPVLISDQKGTLYFFHQSNPVGVSDQTKNGKGFLCHISSDNGKTWDEGHAVGFQGSNVASSPNAAVDAKGNIYFSWVETENASECRSRLMLATSSSGKKWSKPIIITDYVECGAATAPSGGVPCVTDDKRVLISWAQKGSVMLDRSFDGGGMWLSNDINITPGGNPSHLPADHPEADVSPVLVADRTKSQRNGLLFLAYTEKSKKGEDSDVWFIRSNNFGDNWTSTLRVNDDTTATHQYAPVMTVDNTTGYIYIAYFDRREDGKLTDVYLAYSRDSGTTFKNVRLSKAGFTTEGASISRLGISAHKGVVTSVWMEPGPDSKFSLMTSILRDEELPQ